MIAASQVSTETTVLATIAVVLVAAILVMRLMIRFGQPPVIGEILAGIILGPSFLGLLPGNLVEAIFPHEVRPHLVAIAQVGLVLFMFVTGWELDLAMLRRKAPTIAVTSVSAIAIPFGLGVVVALFLYANHSTVDGKAVAHTGFLLYMGTAMAITAFPVLARLLSDKGMQSSRIGSLALACAAAGDVLAWCLLALVMIFVQSTGPASLAVSLGGTAAFVLICVFLVRPALEALTRRAVAGRTGATPLFLAVSAGVLLCSYATSLIGVHAIFGAFVFGLVMPRQPAELLHRAVEVPMRNISSLTLPIFFIVTGLSVDVTKLGSSGLAEGLIILVVACAGKVLGSMVPTRLSGMEWRDSAGLAILMNTRGLTELVILEIGRQLHLIDGALFTLMTLMALVTTAMAAPLLRLLGLVPKVDQNFLAATGKTASAPQEARS